MSENQLKKSQFQNVEMPVTRPNAAGIDIGSTFHAVAVPAGRDEQQVRTFGAMTCDLQQIIDWLKKCLIISVAMESTGVYWRALFTLLVENGFEVFLVNSTNIRNVSGRKTDQDDAMWIQKLHSCGLLKTSYLPDDNQGALRTLVRYRKTLTDDYSRCVLRMQKSLELMNIKIWTVISDITGKTGIKIIEAILKGEKDPKNFLQYVDYRIKADPETIAKSLEGNWREEHLFTLQSSYQLFNHYKDEISKCDKHIEQRLQQYQAFINEGVVETFTPVEADKKVTIKKKNKNTPVFNVREHLKGIHKVDVMEIYGISEISGLQILSETGTDLSKWENEKHFSSWLNLVPNNKVTGGKKMSSKLMKKKPNIASQAFRSAANAVQSSRNWLGDYFRRMKSKKGHKHAIVATANKIAAIYYKMVRNKEEFKPVNIEEYQEKYEKKKIAYLERELEKLKKKTA